MLGLEKSERGLLTLSEDEMRDLGYAVVDMVVEHFAGLRDKQVTRRETRPELEDCLREPLPTEGAPYTEVLDQLERDVFSNIMHLDHPRFFGFVPGPSNFVGAMADALASGFNVFAGTWLEASGPAEVELVTVDWLRQLCGMPEGTRGLFVSGGSMANLTALAVARHTRLGDDIGRAVVYCSDQTHSSIDRGLHLLGFQPEQVCKLPTDDRYRLAVSELERRVAADRAGGKKPFCVIANAGTTNTGAVDPLPELATYCHQEDLWLHVDGAYGAAAVLCEKGRQLLSGLEAADSLVLDPHKWLFQPYGIGAVLVREGQQLQRTFRILPEYLRDAAPGEEELNYCDYGIELTRRFRALKLWMSLKLFGIDAFRQAVARGMELAETAERLLEASPKWEVVTPAQLGVVTFSCRSPELTTAEISALNRALVERMIADGHALLSSTDLRGRTVLRMCTINPRTTETDLESTLQRLEALAVM